MKSQKITDKTATSLDWFILESFGKMLFGKSYEVKVKSNKKKTA